MITAGATSGFEVVTRARVLIDGHAHERVQPPKIHAKDETELWIKVAELAQTKLVNLGMENG